MSRSMKKAAALTLLLAQPALAQAPNQAPAVAPAAAQPLDLSTVVSAALDHGPKVARADFRLAQAQGRAQQAAGAFDWRASARGGWARLYYPKVQTVGGARVLTDDLQSSWDPEITAGASKLFRNGIQIQPGITFYPGSAASSAQTIGLTRPRPNLNLQIPLLHGFDGTNEASANERASLEEVDASKLERGAAQQQSTMESAETYWRCLAAGEEEDDLEDNLLDEQTYIDTQRKLMAAGQISPLALEKALAAQDAKVRRLDTVRSAGAQCRATLAALLGRDSNMKLPTLAAAFAQMDGLSSDAAALRETSLVDTAYRNRPDLHALEQYVTAAGEKLAAARASQDPRLNLVIDPNGFFVTFTYSLEGNAEQGATTAASAQAGEARLNLSQMKDQIRQDVSQGVAALRSSLAALADRRRAEETLTKVAADAQSAVDSGGMDLATLRGLQDQRTDARIALIEARLECALNLAALRLVTGTLVVEGGDAGPRNAVLLKSLRF
ncbi:MAG: TolC family protein [Alphaproteobacteria bacterium]|nr:TolC family protein [Alphaproteobacteria bacterium]